MSAFTKVLIVFVCLLSAIFAASQVVLYTKRANYGELYNTAATQLQTTQAELRAAKGEASDWKGKFDTTQVTLQSQIGDLKAELEKAKTEAASLNTNLGSQVAAVRQLTVTVDGLRADLKAKQDLADKLTATLTDRDATIQTNKTEIAKLMTEGAEKDKTIGDLQTGVLELKKDKKELEVARADYETIIGNLIERNINIQRKVSPPIDARVVGVDSNLRTAVIDKGADARVTANTDFTIYRDSEYVGSLVISDVGDKVALGRLTLLAKGKMPEIGDKATTRVQAQ